jgi:hypothetical protein
MNITAGLKLKTITSEARKLVTRLYITGDLISKCHGFLSNG